MQSTEIVGSNGFTKPIRIPRMSCRNLRAFGSTLRPFCLPLSLPHHSSTCSLFHHLLSLCTSWDRGDSRPAPRNSRWNDGGGGGGRGGGGINAKGFHGNMNEDLRLEKQLFNTTEHASQGINFDRVCMYLFVVVVVVVSMSSPE